MKITIETEVFETFIFDTCGDDLHWTIGISTEDSVVYIERGPILVGDGMLRSLHKKPTLNKKKPKGPA